MVRLYLYSRNAAVFLALGPTELIFALRPLLSICIPTFNRSELLNVCLATVLPQTVDFADIVEVVVSDNASSDATQTLLSKYAERYRFRNHRNKSNIGFKYLGSGKNKALDGAFQIDDVQIFGD